MFHENTQVNLDAEENIRRKIEVEIPTRTKATKRKAEAPSAEIVPDKFKKHVLSLGFQESDAAVLYKKKDDWMGISTGWLQVIFLQPTLKLIIRALET